MYTPTYAETLRLIARLPERRPYATLPDRLAPLFRRLAGVSTSAEATVTEDFIWSLWMSHPNAAAERVLDLATGDIAAQRFDIADTRLTRLLPCPWRHGSSAVRLPRGAASPSTHGRCCPQLPQHP
jgi:hypothetical protein